MTDGPVRFREVTLNGKVPGDSGRRNPKGKQAGRTEKVRSPARPRR